MHNIQRDTIFRSHTGCMGSLSRTTQKFGKLCVTVVQSIPLVTVTNLKKNVSSCLKWQCLFGNVNNFWLPLENMYINRATLSAVKFKTFSRTAFLRGSNMRYSYFHMTCDLAHTLRNEMESIANIDTGNCLLHISKLTVALLGWCLLVSLYHSHWLHHSKWQSNKQTNKKTLLHMQ